MSFSSLFLKRKNQPTKCSYVKIACSELYKLQNVLLQSVVIQ